MNQNLSRLEAEAFVASFEGFQILLDQPDWPECNFAPLVDLWRERCADGKLPSQGDIDLVLVPALVPLIQIYRVVKTPAGDDEAKVTFQGGMISSFTREETDTLAFTDDAINDDIRKAYRIYFDFITRWDQPVWVEGALTSWRKSTFQKEKYVSLPLSNGGLTIDGAMTASHFFKRTKSQA